MDFAPLSRQRRETERQGTSSVWPDASLGLRPAIQLPQRGSLLDPTTVKTGTTILYIGGSILVILAAVLLITKRRMNAED